jgi:hypothetical protein
VESGGGDSTWSNGSGDMSNDSVEDGGAPAHSAQLFYDFVNHSFK